LSLESGSSHALLFSIYAAPGLQDFGNAGKTTLIKVDEQEEEQEKENKKSEQAISFSANAFYF